MNHLYTVYYVSMESGKWRNGGKNHPRQYPFQPEAFRPTPPARTGALRAKGPLPKPSTPHQEPKSHRTRACTLTLWFSLTRFMLAVATVTRSSRPSHDS